MFTAHSQPVQARAPHGGRGHQLPGGAGSDGPRGRHRRRTAATQETCGARSSARGSPISPLAPIWTPSCRPIASSRSWTTDGVFRNSQHTILGADDKAAVAALLHATELLKGSDTILSLVRAPFHGIRGDRTGRIKHFGQNVLTSPFAAVFDSAGPVGGITVKAPSHETFRATFRGRAAHAGVEPERGAAPSRRRPKPSPPCNSAGWTTETSANIGVIHGGVATNIVPDLCEIEGECRSHDEEKLARVAARHGRRDADGCCAGRRRRRYRSRPRVPGFRAFRVARPWSV